MSCTLMRWCTNFRIEIVAPLVTTGGRTTFTRDPSGRRADGGRRLLRGDGCQRLQTAPFAIRVRLLLCRLALLAGVARHVEDELERFAALFVAPALGQPFRERRHLAIAVLWDSCDAV